MKGSQGRMKRILVTGGAGMIGSNLVKRLVNNNVGNVFVADNLWRGNREYLKDEFGNATIDFNTNFFELDLRDPQHCRQVVEGMNEVYHLADVVAGISYVFSNQIEVFRSNALIDTNMLHAASEAGVAKFVYVGTACSYPKDKQFGVEAPPLMEDDILPAYPESAYGWIKLFAELQTDLYGKETSMKTGILRLHNVYGSPTDYSETRSQVIPSLIVKAIKYPAEKFVVWGSGSQGRSFVHVDDVVDALMLMMERGLGVGPIQIGTDYCTSIREIAEIIIKISGKAIRAQYDLMKPEGDKGRCGNCTKAENLLGWKPKISLQEGLSKVYEWIYSRMQTK
jgi:GDP-D-mannose 3', 5'-epimerase